MQEIEELGLDFGVDVSRHAWICVDFSSEPVDYLMCLMVYSSQECVE